MALKLRKKLLFAGLAWLLVMSPILILELCLFFSGWTGRSELEDPYLGLSGDQKLFELDATGTEFSIKDSRLGFFRPASFQATKPERGFRVFVMGGSTVQGRPWETETAFSSWLRLGLEACLPDRHVEVVNCGGVSYASYRLRFIVDEVLQYEPDLLIICTGHNEFLEQRTYRVEKGMPAPIVFIHRVFSCARSYRWLRSQIMKLRKGRQEPDQLGENVITKLDYENGLELFREENLQRDQVRQHFRFNVSSMLRAAHQKNVPCLLLEPVANMKDCFPFKPTDDWQVGERSRYAKESDLELADVKLAAELESDSQSADYYYFKGRQALQRGQAKQARLLFESAIDRDICPLRITSGLRHELRNAVEEFNSAVARDEQVDYLNLQILCETKSSNGIVGNECLVDHVHPSIATHKLIAKWLTEQLQSNGVIPSTPNWETEYLRRIETHQSNIDFGYYQRGRERLRSVLKWSRGQAIDPIKY